MSSFILTSKLKQAKTQQQEVVFLQTYFVITAFYVRQRGLSHCLIQLHQTAVVDPLKMLIKSFLVRRFRRRKRRPKLRLRPRFTNIYPLRPSTLILAPRFYLQ